MKKSKKKLKKKLGPIKWYRLVETMSSADNYCEYKKSIYIPDSDSFGNYHECRGEWQPVNDKYYDDKERFKLKDS